MEKLKIAIAFGQAATSSLQEFRLEYPPIVIGALAALGSLNFDIFSVLSVGCLVSFDFFDTLVVTCIAPVLLAAVTLVYALFSAWRDPRLRVSSEFTKVFLVVLFCIYPLVSRKILTTCKSANVCTMKSGRCLC